MSTTQTTSFLGTEGIQALAARVMARTDEMRPQLLAAFRELRGFEAANVLAMTNLDHIKTSNASLLNNLERVRHMSPVDADDPSCPFQSIIKQLDEKANRAKEEEDVALAEVRDKSAELFVKNLDYMVMRAQIDIRENAYKNLLAPSPVASSVPVSTVLAAPVPSAPAPWGNKQKMIKDGSTEDRVSFIEFDSQSETTVVTTNTNGMLRSAVKQYNIKTDRAIRIEVLRYRGLYHEVRALLSGTGPRTHSALSAEEVEIIEEKFMAKCFEMDAIINNRIVYCWFFWHRSPTSKKLTIKTVFEDMKTGETIPTGRKRASGSVGTRKTKRHHGSAAAGAEGEEDESDEDEECATTEDEA